MRQLIGLMMAAAVVLMTAEAGATAQRTFVASTGNDANPCAIVNAASDVTIERCDIASMQTYGIRADAAGARLRVVDTTMRNNSIGISVVGVIDAEMTRVCVEGSAGTGIAIFNGARSPTVSSCATSSGSRSSRTRSEPTQRAGSRATRSCPTDFTS